MKVNSVKKPTLDERIAYALTDRKILHFRYDAHLRQEVFKRLNKTQKTLLNRISAAGIEALSKRQLDKLLNDLKREIAKTYTELTAYTDNELSGFFIAETDALQDVYNGEIGFDFFNQVPDYKRNATRKASLIAGVPLEDWWKKQGAETAFRFEALIRQGLLDGKQTYELVSDVKNLIGTSRRHAETLVITAVAKAADEAHQTLRDENLDLIKGEKHLATLDMRTSDVCRIRDGLMWDIEKKPIDHDLPYQRPPIHPRCRSILQLVIKSWKELGFDDIDEIPESTRASMDGQVSENLNYENWLKTKSPEEQDKVLGKGKADLWRRGVITFRDMLDQSGRPLTLKLLSALNGENRWKQHFSQVNSVPDELPKDLQEVVKIGQELHYKYKDVIEKALINEEPYEAIMEIMRSEGVEIGAVVNVESVSKKEIRSAIEFMESIQRYPKSWVEKANQSGRILTKEIRDTKKKSARAYHAVADRMGLPKEFVTYGKKGLIKQGDTLITINMSKPSAIDRISTNIHEFGHKLQRNIPELDQYFVDFWRERTKGLPIERLRGVTGNRGYGEGEITKKDHFPDPYYGKIYREFGKENPKEMLTMTFESIIGGKKERFLELYEKDPELFNFGLALLMRFKP